MTSSLISLAKRDIYENLPGMVCADYSLPTCKEGTILHVEDSFYYKPDMEGNQDRVAVTSKEIVESIVKMHTTSQIAYKPDQCPALFCVPNEIVTLADLDSRYKTEKAKAIAAQRRWFVALVKMADDDWQQYKRQVMISDIQRTALKELGLKRDWMFSAENEETSTCPFCSSNLIDPRAPICPTCLKVHNPIRMAEIEAKMKAPVNKTVQ